MQQKSEIINLSSINNMKKSLFHYSEKFREKEKCGDHAGFLETENGLVIAAVADGVGSYRCDWLASERACKGFLKKCAENKTERITEAFLETVIHELDEDIVDAPNQCGGMMSCMAAVVWDSRENWFYYLNIGDTRIYKKTRHGMELITIDESKAVLMKDSSGKFLTSGGSVVIRSGLTNALGQGSVTCRVSKSSLGPGECLILASDGFYDRIPAFEEKLSETIDKVFLEGGVKNLFAYNQQHFTDDSTALFIRSDEFPLDVDSITPDKEVLNNLSEKTPFHILTLKISEALKKSAEAGDAEAGQFYTRYMLEKGHVPTKVVVDVLIKTMMKITPKAKPLFNDLVKLMGQAVRFG